MTQSGNADNRNVGQRFGGTWAAIPGQVWHIAEDTSTEDTAITSTTCLYPNFNNGVSNKQPAI